MTQTLYKFHQYCGRQGTLEGVFIADSEEVDRAMGYTAFFYEVLGKHSEIELTISPDNIKTITDDPNVIDIVLKYELETGINPLGYLHHRPETNDTKSN